MSAFISGKHCPLLCLCQWYPLRPINLCWTPCLPITLIRLAMITSDRYINALDGVRLLPMGHQPPRRDFPALKRYGLSWAIREMQALPLVSSQSDHWAFVNEELSRSQEDHLNISRGFATRTHPVYVHWAHTIIIKIGGQDNLTCFSSACP